MVYFCFIIIVMIIFIHWEVDMTQGRFEPDCPVTRCAMTLTKSLCVIGTFRVSMSIILCR